MKNQHGLEQKPMKKNSSRSGQITYSQLGSFWLLQTSIRVWKRVEMSRFIVFKFTYFLILLIFKIRHYSLDIYPFWFGSAFNTDCSICMNWRDGPWFTVILTFRFVEDTIFPYQYFITNLAIIINMVFFLSCSVKISLALPITISYFAPVSHVATKDCCTWRGFAYCMVGRVNGPWCIS